MHILRYLRGFLRHFDAIGFYKGTCTQARQVFPSDEDVGMIKA